MTNYNPLRHFKKIKQINNLSIYLDNSVAVTCYKVATPRKILLEEFCFLKDAETFCNATKDFLTKKK